MSKIRINDLPSDEENEEVNSEALKKLRGGGLIDNKMLIDSSLRVQLQQSRNKTSTSKSFSEIAKEGLSNTDDDAPPEDE